MLGMDDRAVHDIVRDRQQRADIGAVGLGPLLHPTIAVAGRRQLLGIKAALRAGRDDDRVLHHLRLDQAHDLGTEIIAPVGPANAAARDRPPAQVNAFEARSSAEHTSELQSLMRISYAVFCLKKNIYKRTITNTSL